jgi:type I restriction enzyme S subunit
MEPLTALPTKPSGIPWLGEVPAHWEVKRLKYLASINDDALPESADPTQEIVYVEIGGVDAVEGIVAKEQLVLEDAPSRARRLVRHGDTVVSTVRTYLRAIAPIHDPEPNLVVSTGFAVIRPRELDPDYLGYALRSPLFIETIVSRSTGVSYPGINASEIGNIEVAYPPLPEQRAIAAFLDERTARIDALVARKRRLVQLLKEKRQALITRAVTRGLDPKVKMKESGVPWLGEVPEHWEVKRLKDVLSEPMQYGANEAAELEDLDLPRYVRITDVDDAGNLREETFRSLPTEVARPYLLRDGDILFARSGATVGKTFLYAPSWGTACYAGYLIRARCDKASMYAPFLYRFVNSRHYWQWLDSNTIQATIQNVSADKYKGLPIPVPPLPEQRAIAAFLDERTARIDNLITKIEQAVERLQEYRTALISAAVTGKVRVPIGRSEDQMIGQ